MDLLCWPGLGLLDQVHAGGLSRMVFGFSRHSALSPTCGMLDICVYIYIYIYVYLFIYTVCTDCASHHSEGGMIRLETLIEFNFLNSISLSASSYWN